MLVIYPVTMRFVVLLAAAIALASADDQCKTMPSEEKMKEAQPIADEIMKKCIHLLDKYPVPLHVIGEAMHVLCDDYAQCHDKLESLASTPDKYRIEITQCTRPHLVAFCKSRAEIDHDPDKLADELNECILEHVPLDKTLGIATGVWVMKILGIPVGKS